MAMTLEKVVPFGRSLDEYRRMFALSDADLSRNIVGVGDGPASFNAEMHQLGKRVLSLDPVYVFHAAEIERQFHAVVDNICAQVKATPDDWVWTYHRSPDALRQSRTQTLQKFLADYETGRKEGRYQIGELPKLALTDASFDLALCSHFLFLYSAHFSYEFHRDAVFEMLRVAKEVRLFPLLTLAKERSAYVDPLCTALKSAGYVARVEKVDFELQKGGNEMLRVVREG